MFNTEQSKLLEVFFSNLDKNVFVLKNMPEVLKGALFSRYSRSDLPLRELFLKEYLYQEKEAEPKQIQELEEEINKIRELDQVKSGLNVSRAEKFYSKWLGMYGDDSIAELAGIHIGIENISVLATKSIEDRRIGISPLEKSTRYVKFDDKVDGKYKYYEDPKISKSPYSLLYKETMDNMFDTYSFLKEPMQDFFKMKFPKPDDVSETAYKNSIKAKAFDTIRGLLPLSTLTNMGIFSNGRAIEYLLTRMYSEELTEVKSFADLIHANAKESIPNFVERLDSELGEMYIKYLSETEKDVLDTSRKIFDKSNDYKYLEKQVKLIEFEWEAQKRVVANILYPYLNISYEEVLNRVKGMHEEEIKKVLEKYVQKRKGRWHKAGKAFEEIYYTFEIVSDFGAYKDLQRHRIATRFRQLFTTQHGYEVPQEIIEAGYEDKYRQALDQSHDLYMKLKDEFPYESQYVVSHAHNVRWKIKMNLREAFHLCELRSSPQGHPSYRKIAQQIHEQIKKVHPLLGESMGFVCNQDPGLERLSAEVRKEERLNTTLSNIPQKGELVLN